MLEKYPSHGAITLFTLPKKLQTIQMIDFRVIAIFGQIYKDFVCFILRFRMHRSYTEITVAFRTSSFSPRPTCGSALLTVNIILLFFFGTRYSRLDGHLVVSKTFDRLYWTAAADFV